jgi:hypothetical protein
MFKRCFEENTKQAEAEKKKAEKDAKDAERERIKASPANSRKEADAMFSPLKARVG